MLAIEIMDALERTATEQVYQVQEPRQDGYLTVGDGHALYWALYGNPEGTPVVLLHGGPGIGCSASMSRYFDPQLWNVIMFDQRGAGRSTPFLKLEHNTPQKLIQDMEALREYLGIDQWMLFGGSWGSTLALLYGQEHPEHCLGFILRGIFLAREDDAQALFTNMANVFPDAAQPVLDLIPEEERGDLFMAYYRRIMNPDPSIHFPAAQALMRCDFACSTCLPNEGLVDDLMANSRIVMASRIFCHYAYNSFWLQPDQILSRMDRISHLPAILVHGRWDVICLPEMAYKLHQSWPGSRLWFVPDGGHSAGDPPIATALTRSTDQMAKEVLMPALH